MNIIYEENPVEDQIAYADDLMINQHEASVLWMSRIVKARVDGKTIELFQLIPDTVEVKHYDIKAQHEVTLSLDDFEEKDNSFYGYFNPAYNCHGLTLCDKKYWVDNVFAEQILRMDYDRIRKSAITGDMRVVIGLYRKGSTDVWHSCLLKNGKYSHKRGITEEVSSNLHEINKDYPNCTYRYFVKKKDARL